MQLDTVTFIIAIASFIGVVIGPALGGWVRLRELEHQAKQQARGERIAYLLDIQNRLIQAYSEFTGEVDQGSLRKITALFLSVADGDYLEKASNESIDAFVEREFMRLSQLIKHEMTK